jgi:hypothetical protein
MTEGENKHLDAEAEAFNRRCRNAIIVYAVIEFIAIAAFVYHTLRRR